MRLGIYPGSFNPVHKGHMSIINYLIDNSIVDKVIVLPTPEYWDKEINTKFLDRVNMLNLISNDNIIIDTIHSNHEYTYELLRDLKNDYKEDELYLILGADNITHLDKWEHVDEILQNKIIVFKRDNIDINSYLEKYKKDVFIVISDFTPLDISSTNIRMCIDEKCLDEKVLNYIKDNKLYN